LKVQIQKSARRAGIKIAPIRRAIEKTLEGEDQTNAEVSVLLVTNARIRELNLLYRGVDSPTDVLAFAMNEGEFPGLHPQLLGDIVISVEMAEKQARDAEHGLMREMSLLAIHGTLHLLGYEDETASGRARMRRCERKYLEYLE
jgi:probable rRNA maturation factor